MTVTVEQVDEAILGLGSRSLVPEEDVPAFLDCKGKVPIVSERFHEDALGGLGGKTVRYAPYWDIVDLLLDLRNEIEPPIHEMTMGESNDDD